MREAMTRAEIWLQDTLGMPLGIDDLAAHLGYSTSQVRRQFGHHFGSSPRVYRDRRRLEHAAVLLALGVNNIAQIGVDCGYQNHSAFSRAFQRLYGRTPRGYRHALREVLDRHPPSSEPTLRIEKKSSHHAIMRRLYEAPPTVEQLGNPRLHMQDLVRLDRRYSGAAPSVALPDLLPQRIGACTAGDTSPRMDIGLCLASQSGASRLPLPATYRRIRVDTQHYATIYLKHISQLDDAINGLIGKLLRQSDPLHISGKAPCLLWLENYLELRVPLAL